MKKNILVSIIIPVFNCERYIKECIDSILMQTHTEIEVILINDGSTDTSLDIMNKYQDKRIIIVDSENQGVSSARNLGLKYAKGEYIGFADPDDILKPIMIEMMLEESLITSADIVICRYERIDENGESLPLTILKTQKTKRKLTAREAQIEMLKHEKGLFMGHVCIKLFRHTLIKNLKFSKKIHCYEDLMYSINACYEAKNIIFLPISLYQYREHSESIMMRTYSDKQMTAIYALNIIRDSFMNDMELYKKSSINLAATMVRQAKWACESLRWEKAKYYLVILKDKLWIEKNYMNQCSWKTRIQGLLMININLYIYYCLMKFAIGIIKIKKRLNLKIYKISTLIYGK